MKKQYATMGLASLLMGCFMLIFSLPGLSFGFFAHRSINRMAVFALPPEMIGMYKQNIEFISERSIDPDKRAHAMPGEAPRHYIDIDHFGDDPFALMPRKWADAVEVFTEDTLQLYGVLPWHIDVMMHRLRRAFLSNDMDQILLMSAHLGHYTADACTPLHTTKHYNGRTPEERGIHALWESRLPELFSKQYTFLTGRADYVHSPLDRAWELIEISHLKVDTIYQVFDSLMTHFPHDRIFAYEMRGQALNRVYSRDFSEAFHDALKGMVERQKQLAAKATADFWFTAWVDAGQPDLKPFQNRRISRRTLRLLEQEQQALDKEPEQNARYELE
ncbi:MAG: zinc dependent phospholipase C family protein [Bacteroidales bacterium]|nr:zinc dependent phospholipase C family protein [Bacteroidales bacterium]